MAEYRQPPEIENARKYFEKAIELEPDEQLHYYEYGKMIRDHVRDYEEAEGYYLKCKELLVGEYVDGSYGYLLYLMGRYDKARLHIEIQMEYDYKHKQSNYWGQFYYGVLNEALGNHEIAEERLLKAVEFVDTKASCKNAIDTLKVIKRNDMLHIEYYNKFQKLLSDKFN